MAGTIVADTFERRETHDTRPVDSVIKGVVGAWCNFNGSGTIAILDSYNVTSLTDNGTGDYDVNLTTALSSANGACVCGGTSGVKVSGSYPSYAAQARLDTTSVIKVATGYVNGVPAQVKFDHADISVAVYVNP